ncbi:hypothetical protein SD457_13360 [Coprobacillaceae bacterium CR2/5/TPMF4]|nr:hypothetical protein SD457_13360 [Coprobacillaceae bacterium CR2/5/TPMF4]
MKGVLAAALATTLVSQFAYTAVNANMLDDSDLENKNVVEPEDGVQYQMKHNFNIMKKN